MLSWRRFRREFVTVAVSIAAVFSARSSLADHYYVPSGSMLPTVHVDDRVFVNKLAYGVRVPFFDLYALNLTRPAHGDVVVLTSPEDRVTLLKRVVAVPGDRVTVSEGQLQLNGRSVPISTREGETLEQLGNHAHGLDLDYGGGPTFGPVLVPAGQFLVLGDNRGNSHDGRMFGFVRMDSIIGRASGVFFRDGRVTWIGL